MLLLVAISLPVLCIGLWLRRRISQAKTRNFFASEHEEFRGKQADEKTRSQTLRRRFKIESVPGNLDAIVIGSGVGGLTCAGLMARAGKRVLVLEQHDCIGGCTHTHRSHGYEFDVGIHVVGDVAPGSANRLLVDFVTDGQLDWAPMDDKFDNVVICGRNEVKRFSYRAGVENSRTAMLGYFPGEKKAIDWYFDEIAKHSRYATQLFTFLKVLPLPLLRFLAKIRILKLLFRTYHRFASSSLADVLDDLTGNKELKTVLTYSFGNYGTAPRQVPFFMHMMITTHFLCSGGFYPVGGSSEIAYKMIPGINRSGGAVLGGAKVSEIIFRHGSACGVRLRNHGKVEIFAPVVISNAGLHNTYMRLLPPTFQHGLLSPKLMDDLKCRVSSFEIVVGLNGSNEELGLEAKNFFIYQSNDLIELVDEVLSRSRDEAVNSPTPLLFVSFPSAKDPTWDERFPGKATCVIATLARTEWFEEWQDAPCARRGPLYENLKRAFVDQAWSQVVALFPQLKDRVNVIQSGTPLTYKHYINSVHGELYGVNHNADRFSIEHAIHLRPETRFPGLYLTGQDVFTCGFIGAALGGLLTASKVLKKQLIIDLVRQARYRN